MPANMNMAARRLSARLGTAGLNNSLSVWFAIRKHNHQNGTNGAPSFSVCTQIAGKGTQFRNQTDMKLTYGVTIGNQRSKLS